MKFLIIYLFTILYLFYSINGEQEKVQHGSPSSQFKDKHLKDGHDLERDHEAILGSKHLAEEFSDLSESESKKRLKVLAEGQMDADRDKIVTMDELSNYVYKSLISLDKEETDERFEEIDTDRDGQITWKEYLQDSFGIDAGNEEERMLTDPEEAKLMNEDRKYFSAADTNKDSKLNMEEFEAFQNPEHFSHMHTALIENTLSEKDADKDQKISLKEFMGETYDQPSSEWFTTEKERFVNEYDLNKDGFLEGEELRQWLIPDMQQTARQEAQHLLLMADEDKDGNLTIDEIVNAYKAFVGSEATNYGEKLLDIQHEEL